MAEIVARPGSGAMFDGIAARYDVLNRLMSLGMDERWRRLAVSALALPPGARVLDLATGTADVALRLARAYPDAQILGIDPSREMLAVGRRKVEAVGLSGRVVLQEGVAEDLPCADSSIDGVTIAFGIRNVPDRARALREIARVLRPGRRVAILELTEPPGALARFHVHHVVPRLGALLSAGSPYGYLASSIAAFPPAPEFAGAIAAAGLDVLEVRPFALGATHLFVAARPGVA
jgi:demethylmenaquinone methyltransferase/2-methoxy-6-polyprenyl-1,4-benzoquinol methylase